METILSPFTANYVRSCRMSSIISTLNVVHYPNLGFVP